MWYWLLLQMGTLPYIYADVLKTSFIIFESWDYVGSSILSSNFSPFSLFISSKKDWLKLDIFYLCQRECEYFSVYLYKFVYSNVITAGFCLSAFFFCWKIVLQGVSRQNKISQIKCSMHRLDTWFDFISFPIPHLSGFWNEQW